MKILLLHQLLIIPFLFMGIYLIIELLFVQQMKAKNCPYFIFDYLNTSNLIFNIIILYIHQKLHYSPYL